MNIHERQNSTALHALMLTVALVFVPALFGCSADPAKKYDDAMSKAEAYKQEKKWDEARVSLMAALSAKPREAKAHFELAEVLVQLKRFPQAIDEYETALNLDPQFREARLHVAALFLAARQIELAESHVMKLLEANASDVEAQILKGNIEASRRNYPAARVALNKVLEMKPDNSAALASLGDIASQEGNAQEAEDFFTKALRGDPKNNPIRLALADLYLKQGRTDEANEILENLVQESPTNTSLRYFYGELLLARGQGNKAEEQYAEMLKTDPQRYDARDRLYDMYVVQRKKNAALALTKDIVAKFPDEPATQYFRGRDAELDGKLEEARQFYLKALEGMHNFAPLFRRIGLAEMQLGYNNEAVEHLNQAVVLNAADVGARLALAHHLFLRREFAQAREHVEKLLRAYPRQLGANILKADLALIDGDIKTAEKIYSALTTTLPDNPVGFYKMALLEERRNQPTRAIELYKQGLAFDKDVLVALRRLTGLLMKQNGPQKTFEELTALKAKSEKSKADYNIMLGSVLLSNRARTPEDIERARGLFNEAIAQNPNSMPAYMALGQLDELSGNFAKAEESYKKIIEAQPKQVASRMLLAMTYERQGKMREAADQYKEIIGISPRFAPAANNLAWLLANDLNGDLDEALRLAQIAKEEMPRESSVADTLAWVYHKRGSSRAALPVIEEAAELARSGGGNAVVNPEILYHLGVIRDALGDKDGAKQALNEALETGSRGFPSKPAAEELLKKLS